MNKLDPTNGTHEDKLNSMRTIWNLGLSVLFTLYVRPNRRLCTSAQLHIFLAWVSEKINGEIQHGLRSWWVAAILQWGVLANQLHSWNAVIPVLCTNFVTIIVISVFPNLMQIAFVIKHSMKERILGNIFSLCKISRQCN